MPKSKTKRMRELSLASYRREPKRFFDLQRQCIYIANVLKCAANENN